MTICCNYSSLESITCQQFLFAPRSCTFAGNDCRYGGLGSFAKADEELFRSRQASPTASSSVQTSTGASLSSAAACVLSAACSSNRVKRRRRRSWASGAGLQVILTTRSSGASLAGLRFLFCLLASSILYHVVGAAMPWATGVSLAVCRWAAGPDGRGEPATLWVCL